MIYLRLSISTVRCLHATQMFSGSFPLQYLKSIVLISARLHRREEELRTRHVVMHQSILWVLTSPPSPPGAVPGRGISIVLEKIQIQSFYFITDFLSSFLPFTVDGGFTEWSEYSACNKTCGKGKKTRTRECTNPPPSGGGKNCKGKYSETKKCKVRSCKGMDSKHCNPYHYRSGSDEATTLVTLAEYRPELKTVWLDMSLFLMFLTVSSASIYA